VEFVSFKMEKSHSDFSEVTWMISIHGSSIVGETTGITSTAGMFSISSDSTSTAAD
jgi:hypothetical protein